jgi:tetratricopeptide (TPR) repeat protein
MIIRTTAMLAAFALFSMSGFAGAATGDAGFDEALLSLQREWAHANYQTADKKERRAAFEAVVDAARSLSERSPDEVAAVAWNGIVLSTYAGEVSALSAMKVAKAALAELQRAESMDADALAGGIYASLGALYSKVPGGFVGFGDDELAREYFERALGVDAAAIDNNYFYAEFLIEHGEYRAALDLLNRALETAVDNDRPVFDAGRRAEIRDLIRIASNQTASIR